MKFGFGAGGASDSYKQILERVLYAEELGFESTSLPEHHGLSHVISSPLIGLAGLATRTSRIKLGTSVLLLPLYDPVHVAEDTAMLDIMSDGRFILGAAIGYRPGDFDLFHVDLRNRGARFEEQVKLLRLLWSEDDVDFNGRFFQLSGATVEPKPLTPGGPPIWLGCWGDLSLRRAATLCDAWLPTGTSDLPKLLECQAKYRTFLREADKDPASVPTLLPRSMVIAETREKAIEMAEPMRLHYRDEYGGAWQHPLIGALDPSRFDDVLDIGRDRFIIGNPDDCIREIRRYQEQFGVDYLMCGVGSSGTPHEFVMNALRLIANEVMPAFA